MKWYSYKPQDTLFFRGAESAEMGADHSASTLFPPSPETITGSLRTAVLLQNDIPFNEYTDEGFSNAKIISTIGRSKDSAPFSVTGPLFKDDNDIYIPAPYSWFISKENNKTETGKKNNVNENVKPVKAQFVKSSLFLSDDELLWATGKDCESVGGKWFKLKDLNKETITLYEQSYFAETEIRTGIALDGRNVRKSHLYSFRHYRLKPGVELVFGIDKEIPVADTGVLKLGAEQRFGEYRLIKNIELPETGQSKFFMCLSPAEGKEETNNYVVAAGKLIYRGGWDMRIGFHKPMKGYFPAGSVFKEKINNNFIGI